MGGHGVTLADGPRMPVTSTLLDQAHNALERKLFAMKGFHHPHGSQQACLTGLAHLSNLIPYPRRASMPVNVGWQWKGEEYRQPTGSSVCRSLPLEAFAEWRDTLPHHPGGMWK